MEDTSMKTLAFLLVLLPAAFAGPAAEDTFKFRQKQIKKLTKEQRDYAKKKMKAELRTALKWVTGNWYSMEGRADKPNVFVPNVRGYEMVYSQWAFADRAKGTHAMKIAALNDSRAVKFLTSELFVALKAIADADKLLKVSKAIAKWYIHDQEPGIRRYGATIYRRYLVTALSSLKDPESRQYLRKKAWSKARAFDTKTRRDLGRIALMDVFARNGCPQVTELLHKLTQSDEPRIRIVALEAVAARGGAKKILRGHLQAACNDACYAVRATAIDLLKELGDGHTVGPLAEMFGKSKGAERARIHAALTHIVGRDLGWLPENWSGWFKKHRAQIERACPLPGTTTRLPGTATASPTASATLATTAPT